MSQSNDIASQNESKWKFKRRKPQTVASSQYKSSQYNSRNERDWRCSTGVVPQEAAGVTF